jgi:CPA2 family monovalent cation:H+ antiporter-2
LLIFSLGMCFGMVVLAAQVGFSPAFGAFIMGSILAETVEAESIARIVAPVKDLFGAIFFVSVGMMVDPAMIGAYAGPIIAITLAILFGQVIFGSGGVLLAGQPLKVAMQCGFSLTQIGEFAFIIASLGVSLGVTSDFLYPIVVAVSVITTFLTPYMIRLAVPAYNWVDRRMPEGVRRVIDRYTSGTPTVNRENHWRDLLVAVARIVAIYVVLCISIVLISFHFVMPLINRTIPAPWGNGLSAAVTILCLAPFLRAIVMKKNHSIEFQALWHDNRYNRAPLLSLILLRVVIAVMFVMTVIEKCFRTSTTLVVGIALALVCLMVLSRWLKKQSIYMERTFIQNFRYREMHEEFVGKKRPEYEGHLLSRDLHLSDFTIPAESLWAGLTLRELNFGHKYGVHVASVIRGLRRINIPGANVRLFPGDTIQVIGTDEQLAEFGKQTERVATGAEEDDLEKREMELKQFVIATDSPFLGKNIRESGLRDRFKCLVVGVEKQDGELHAPDVSAAFEEGDVVWVVGEKNDVKKLL